MRSPLSRLLALTLALGAGLAAPCLADETVRHSDRWTLDAPRGGSLTVDVSFHDVYVKAGGGDRIEVLLEMEVTAGSEKKAQEFLEKNLPEARTKGDDVVIALPKRGFSLFGGWNDGGWHNKARGRLEILVPEGMDLVLDTASGDCLLDGDFGDAEVRCDTASGNVVVQGRMDALDADTASGDVDAEFSGPIRSFKADTASGNVKAKGLTGSVHVDTASGDVAAWWDSIREDDRIHVDTASGDVRLYLPEDVNLDGEVDTASGDIDSDFGGRESDRGRHFRFEGGRDPVRIHVDTASGDVEVRTR